MSKKSHFQNATDIFCMKSKQSRKSRSWLQMPAAILELSLDSRLFVLTWPIIFSRLFAAHLLRVGLRLRVRCHPGLWPRHSVHLRADPHLEAGCWQEKLEEKVARACQVRSSLKHSSPVKPGFGWSNSVFVHEPLEPSGSQTWKESEWLNMKSLWDFLVELVEGVCLKKAGEWLSECRVLLARAMPNLTSAVKSF